MKKSLLCAVILLSFIAAARAETVHLEGDVACDSVEVQQTRVQLTRIIMTTDNEQAKDQATRDIIALTDKRCVPLTGIFTVQAKERGLLKVNTREGATLWLVE